MHQYAHQCGHTPLIRSIWANLLTYTTYQRLALAGRSRQIHNTCVRHAHTSPFTKLTPPPSQLDTLRSAITKASKLSASRRGQSEKRYTGNLARKRLQCIHDNTYNKLVHIIQQFPATDKLHPFERNLVELSLCHDDADDDRRNGIKRYNDILKQFKSFCNSLLSVYQQYSSQLLSHKQQSAVQIQQSYADAVDAYTAAWDSDKATRAIADVTYLTKVLYKLPVLDPAEPTVALVGLPNTGKSSIVRAISTGKPEVQNYSFTTRGIVVGHVHARVDRDDGQSRSYRIQVTDTPGLLPRADVQRKNIELLTLSVMKYMTLKPVVLNVIDLSCHCGYSIEAQLAVRHELRARYGDTVEFIDVCSKSDLDADSVQVNGQLFDYTYINAYDSQFAVADMQSLPTDALFVSTATGQNIDELKQLIIARMLPHLIQSDKANVQPVEPPQFIVPY